ncbi:MAG: TetR/AcrR family transcriptional regulator [Firmicutes bacterium]|jgi:TetR/AcrR family fatty acid metabolism transcriptional regulator|nr:TetR/AcrR family transcriptional regulator [Bacillota bacterium]
MDSRNEKKDLIRRAAVKVIAGGGYPQATAEKIAAEAGIAVGTIYNYFRNKEEIITSIFRGEYQKRNDFYGIIEQMELEPLEKIRAAIEMHFTGLNHHSDLYRVVALEKNYYLRSISGDDAPDDGLRDFILDVLRKGINDKRIRECDVDIVASMICGAMEVVIADYLQNKIVNIEGAVGEIMETLRTGIAFS